MAGHYELVIFTAGTQEYADWVIDAFHEQVKEFYSKSEFAPPPITHRLYR